MAPGEAEGFARDMDNAEGYQLSDVVFRHRAELGVAESMDITY